MGKSIGVITIVNVGNYGAELQAYATQKALQLMGYDAELINYPFYKSNRHLRTRASHPVFKLPAKKVLAEVLFPILSSVGSSFHRRTTKIRDDSFKKFHLLNTRFSEEHRSIEDLYRGHADYDVYMVGSDQVWNPGLFTSLDPYFLKFASPGKRKISYASSFGVSVLPANAIAYYKGSLSSFDAIGVREQSAVALVDEVSGQKAELVLDPTLLLNAEEWRAVANKHENLPEKYVLLYELTPCQYTKRLAKYVADLLKCRVVRINKSVQRVEKDTDVINVIDAGPAEFIGLIDGASFVVTNSFHGTAFSINFNKPFYAVAPARKDNNSRLISILNLFGLGDRLMMENSSMPDGDRLAMCFTPANKILESERNRSTQYLKYAIEG